MTRLPIKWEYLERRFKEEHTNKKEVSKLLEKGETYLAYNKSKGTGLTNDDILKLRDLMEIDMKELVPRGDVKQVVPKPEEPDNNSKAIDVLFQEIAQLRNKIAELEKKMEEPAIVAIPMQPKEMASKVLGELLEKGWCTKDDVLVEFNKHHIPTQYMNDAVHEHDAVLATSGYGSSLRTFIIKGGKE